MFTESLTITHPHLQLAKNSQYDDAEPVEPVRASTNTAHTYVNSGSFANHNRDFDPNGYADMRLLPQNHVYETMRND